MEEPLLPTTTTTSLPTRNIVARLATLLAVAAVSFYAHHEASKGFQVTIVNSMHGDSVANRRFHVFFVSNGRAARILHHASDSVERVLYPDVSFPRKPVARVTIRMAGHNLTGEASVSADAGADDYVISMSPSLMSKADAVMSVTAAMRRAVALLWLWDGNGTVPAYVVESMVAYLAAGGDETISDTAVEASDVGRCWSARFLRHCEGRRQGFVARLNRAMRYRWDDGAVDGAFGMPVRPVCAAYREALTGQDKGRSDST